MPNNEPIQVHFRAREGQRGRIAYNVIGDGPLVIAIPGMGELMSSFDAQRAGRRDA